MPQIKAFAGIRNDVTAERFSEGDLEIANNVDIDNTGKLLLREGYAKKINGAYHSLWSAGDICLFVTGAQLRRLSSDLTTSTLIRNDLTPNLRMEYHFTNDNVYYSNGKQTGIYNNSGNRTWGIVPPSYQPIAQQDFGDLPAGRYQFALTYVRGDNQESGTGIADAINITTGAIRFTDIAVSSDPAVTHKIIYISTHNGEVLYRAIVLDNTTTSALYNGADLRTPLDTQFMQNAPAGQIIGSFAGYMYVAYDKWLHYSDAFGFELFDLRRYLPFDSVITLFAPMIDGVFVGTQKAIYFMQGRDPDAMKLDKRADYGVIANTLCYVPATSIAGLDAQPDEVAIIFTAQNGICYGVNNGILVNMTQQRYAYDKSSAGAALFKNNNNANQYIAVLRT